MCSPSARLVLVTRPEAEARDTAARLERLGWSPVLAPAIRIAHRDLRLAAGWRPQAIMVTSGNAVPALPERLHGIRLLAVGNATAQRARAAGFRDVVSAEGDAEALESLVAANCDPRGPGLLLPCGEGQGMTLHAALRRRGFRVLRRIAYAALPVPSLPEPARAALASGKVAAALFFSPASARAFASALGGADEAAALRPVRAAAISAATASALALLPWRDIRVASQPNQDELLACLI